MLILGVAGLGLPTLFAALVHDSECGRLLSRWTGGALRRGATPPTSTSASTCPRCATRGRARPARAGRGARRSLALAVTARRDRGRVRGAGRLDQADGRVARRPARVRRADPRAVRRQRRRALLGRPARVSQPGRLRDGDRLRVGHPDRARGERDRRLRRRSRSAASSRSSSTRCSWRRLAAAALVATLVARGGETNWLEGLQLLVIYLIVSVAVWLLRSTAQPDRVRTSRCTAGSTCPVTQAGVVVSARLVVVGAGRELARDGATPAPGGCEAAAVPGLDRP